MAFSIRPARLTDAAAVARLTSLLGYEVTSADVEIRLNRILSQTDQRFVIAEVDGRPVGWVHGTVVDHVDAERFVRVAGLVVDAEQRRGGIGRALMRDIEQWAVEQGCDFVRLTSSLPRTEAHRFYERLGFSNQKTQYSFAKQVGHHGRGLEQFVPRIGR